jgi:hypothetical protein
VAEVVHFWEYISKSLLALASKTRETPDLDQVKKSLVWMVVEHDTAWVGIAHDHGEPVAFAAAQDCTPPFQEERQFVVRWFVHTPTYFKATLELEAEFLRWARLHGVRRYAITTKRDSGAAIRCLMSPKYGFKKGYLTFEKEV